MISNLHLKRLGGFLLMIAIALFGILFRFHNNAIVAENIGPEQYGDFQVTVILIYFLGQIILLGLEGVIAKNIPYMFKKKEFGKAKFLIIELSKLVIFFLIMWAIISLAINLIAHHLQSNPRFNVFIHPSLYYLTYASLWGLLLWLMKLASAKGYVTISFVCFHLPVLIFGVIITNIHITLDTAINTFAISLFIACIIFGALILYVFKNLKSTLAFPLASLIKHDSLNYLLQNILTFSPTSILLITFEAMPVAEKQVGILAVIFLIANLLLTPIIVTKAYFINFISRSMSNPKIEIIKSLRKIYFISTLFFSVCAITAYIFSVHYLYTFGNAFTSAAKLIPLAIIANLPSAMIVGDTFFIKFNAKMNSYLTLISFFKIVFTVYLGIVLITYFEITGAILALLIEEFVYGIIIWKVKNIAINKMAN